MSGPGSLSAGAYQLWLRVKQMFPTAVFTSGARDPSHNSGIPGASNTSQHLTGDAFDFVVPGVDPLDVQKTIAGSLGLPFGQSIAEYGLGMGPRNHLSTGTKQQLMTGNNGKYSVTGIASAFSGKQINTDGLGYGRDALKGLLGDSWGNWFSDLAVGTGDALAAPGNAIENATDWNGWLQRIALIVFALIFIAAALFAFKASDIANVASKAGKALK